MRLLSESKLKSQGKEDMEETLTTTPLLTPYTMAKFKLKHRIVLAPLTRCRMYGNVPQSHAILYYTQRTTKGGLLISEGTAVAEMTHAYPEQPGIWSKEQVEAWKPIVKAVHDKGGVFFCQIWHAGYVSDNGDQPNKAAPPPPRTTKVLPPFDGAHWSPPPPHRIAAEEIPDYLNDFRLAARNAMEAGFDGVEIVGGDGYLIEQVEQDWANNRIEKFVGNMEKRCQFALDVVEAIANEIGADRVGLKLSPFEQPDPENLGVYMANALNQYGIAYLILVEPRLDKLGSRFDPHSLHSMRKAFNGTLIGVGGFKRDDGNKAIEENYVDLVAYGRLFLANPDLPRRFELGAALNKYDRSTFYSHDPVVGYTDYPFLDDISA